MLKIALPVAVIGLAVAIAHVGKGTQQAGAREFLVRSELPEGWRLKLAADPEHADFQVPSLSSTGQALLVATVTSGDYRRLDLSTVALIGMDGTVRVSLPLPGLLPHESRADLSPNGHRVAVIASDYSNPNQDATLLVFDDKGTRLSRKKASRERKLLVGNDWIAFWTSPLDAAYQEQDPPVSQTPGPTEFIRPDGTPLRPRDRIRSALAKMGDGLAAVAGGELSTYGAGLTRRGRATLGFPVGIPYASASKDSLVAVAEYYTPGRDTRTKRLVLFDGDAKKLGTVTLRAALGIEAAVSPDGTAVLATPASLGPEGPRPILEDSPTIELVLADRTGKIRWTHVVKRRIRFEYVASLAVSSGGRRAAFALKTNEAKSPDRIVVLDEKGAILYQSESVGTVKGLWLDPSGESIFLTADLAISHQRISALVRGAAPGPGSD